MTTQSNAPKPRKKALRNPEAIRNAESTVVAERKPLGNPRQKLTPLFQLDPLTRHVPGGDPIKAAADWCTAQSFKHKQTEAGVFVYDPAHQEEFRKAWKR